MILRVAVCPGLLAVVSLLLTVQPAAGAPEIQLPTGRILGSDKLSYITRQPYYVYYGIPFAEPPVGQLRFRPPQRFQGTTPDVVISSVTFRPACMQAYYDDRMDEDCLHLNIFVPQGGANVKKVMVWIHGGAFVVGDAKTYEATRLVTDYDVIVVTIQYRLAAFGFASTLDDAQPGNNGLRDQIMALEWVRDYIGQFGGDGSDVTIFGESAGAGSVSLLSISPVAKGLFTKGIMQSGTALSPFSNIKDPAALVYKMADSLGCRPSVYFPGLLQSYHDRMMQCLREKSAEQINSPASWQGGQVNFDVGSLIDHGPVVDGEVIPRNPFELMQDASYLQRIGALDRAYIVGANNAEGINTLDYLVSVAGGTIANVTTPEVVSQYVRSISQYVTPFPLNNDHMNVIDFVYTYPRDDKGRLSVKTIIDLTTDTYFVAPAVLFAKYITQASRQTRVYLYLLDHYPQVKDPSSPVEGSNHGLDILYEFDLTPSLWADSYKLFNYIVLNTTINSPLYQIFGGAVAIFAKTGVPTSQYPPQLTWPTFDPQQQSFIVLSLQPEVRQQIYAQRISLWLDFLPKMAGRRSSSRVAFP